MVQCLSLCKLGKAQRPKRLVPTTYPPLSPLEWVIRLPTCQALPRCRALGPVAGFWRHTSPPLAEGSLQEVPGGWVRF